jgi:putative salt-induced outer membrane protein YdiY
MIRGIAVLVLASAALVAQEPGPPPSAVVEDVAREAKPFEFADVVERVGGVPEACEVVSIGKEGIEIVTVSGPRRVDWNDVVSLRTAKPFGLLLSDGDRTTARVEGVEAGVLELRSETYGALKLRCSALSPLPPPPLPQDAPAKATPLTPHPWKGAVSFSGSFRSGNTDQVLAALRASIERNWEEDRLAFAIEALYGKSEGDETNRSLFGKGRYEHYWSERFYGFAQSDALYDAIQDIDLRSVTSLGVGYTLWKENDDRLFSVEGGLSAIYTSYGTGESQFSPAARAAASYKEIFFDDVRFTQDAEFLLPLDDPGEFLIRSRTAFGVPVAEGWSMKTSLDVNYTGRPANNRKPFDILFLVGLEYQF